MRYRYGSILTFIIAFLFLLFSPSFSVSIPTATTGFVSAVIDGSSFQLSSGQVIQLAAISTPVDGHAGYEESKNYLKNLIQGKTVILDTGITPTTENGKLLCVTYLDYNSTHYENINQAMIQNGYAVPLSQNNNSFDPTNWIWFVQKQTPTASPVITSSPQSAPTPTPTPFSQPTPLVTPNIPEFPVALIILFLAFVTLVVTLKVYKKK